MRFRLYVIALTLTFFLNMWWVGHFAHPYYRSQLGEIFRPEISWFPFFILFALYTAMLVFFVLGPNVRKRNPGRTFWEGMLMGLIAYSMYDLTNLAVVQGWQVEVALADIAWGALSTAGAAWLTHIISTKFLD